MTDPPIGASPTPVHVPDGAVDPALVSVVVPIKDDPRLDHCLAALGRQRLPAGWRVEVVVVDNGSRISPADIVSGHPGVRLVHEDQPGSYAARNCGVRASSGAMVAFTDSDCTPHDDWLAQSLAPLQATPDLAAVAGRVELTFPGDRPSTAAGWWEAVEAFPQQEFVTQGFGATANLLVRRSVGDAVGWFDAGAKSGGDVQFGRAVLRLGGRLAYLPEAVVRHPARTTSMEVLTKARRTARGQTRIRLREGETALGLLLWLAHQFRVLGGNVRRCLTHDRLEGLRSRVLYLTMSVRYRLATVGTTLGTWLEERELLAAEQTGGPTERRVNKANRRAGGVSTRSSP